MVSFSERLQEYEQNLARRSRHLSLSAYLTASSCTSEQIPENGSAEWQAGARHGVHLSGGLSTSSSNLCAPTPSPGVQGGRSDSSACSASCTKYTLSSQSSEDHVQPQHLPALPDVSLLQMSPRKAATDPEDEACSMPWSTLNSAPAIPRAPRCTTDSLLVSGSSSTSETPRASNAARLSDAAVPDAQSSVPAGDSCGDSCGACSVKSPCACAASSYCRLKSSALTDRGLISVGAQWGAGFKPPCVYVQSASTSKQVQLRLLPDNRVRLPLLAAGFDLDPDTVRLNSEPLPYDSQTGISTVAILPGFGFCSQDPIIISGSKMPPQAECTEKAQEELHPPAALPWKPDHSGQRYPGGHPTESPKVAPVLWRINQRDYRQFRADGKLCDLKAAGLHAEATAPMLRAVILALMNNTLVQVLYIHNLGKAMTDDNVGLIIRLLKQGRIFAINIGENEFLTKDAWEALADAILYTNLGFMFIEPNNLRGLERWESRHGPKRRGEPPCMVNLKEWMINRLRENRTWYHKAQAFFPYDKAIVSECHNMWWNPCQIAENASLCSVVETLM